MAAIVGFDCEFLEPPPDVLQTECPVCLQIIREPHQVTCCGKKYCASCIQCVQDSNSSCPTCKAELFHSFLDKGIKQSLYGLKVHCSHQKDGCEWTGELRQLDEHLNTDPLPETQLDGCPLTIINCDFHHVGCAVKLPRQDMPEHQRESLRIHLSKIAINYASLREEMNVIKRENESLKTKVASLRSSSQRFTAIPTKPREKISIQPSNVLIMTNFQQHKRDGNWWYSPPVYTHPWGYKICLGVCARGFGNNSHVSVFVYLMRGEQDDHLTWPLRGTITFQLLDQTGGENHKFHQCVYDDSVELKNCEQVRYGERANSGWGAPTLIAHSALKPQYLNRDCLRFQVSSGEVHINVCE